ncbi:hypothetical protein [Streptomyces sp. NPDC048584]
MVRYRWATAQVCTFLAGGVRLVRADLLQGGLELWRVAALADMTTIDMGC